MTIRITPLDNSGHMVELSTGSRVFEKQILPYGTFSYQGGQFTIDEAWADEAIRAFNEQAVHQTVFALADENNSHNVDGRPDRYAGEVISFTKTPAGLNAVIRATERSAKLIDDTKGKLGVSARFYEGYKRETDNKGWPIVIDQILGTTNPKIVGMTNWKEISLSNIADADKVNVVDASSGEWKMTQPPNNDDPQKGQVTLTQVEYDQLKKLLEGQKPSELVEGEDALPKILDELDKTDNEKDDKPSQVNNKNAELVRLSNERITQLSRDVASSRFDRDALAWKQAGVPPKVVELARPVLTSYDEVRVVTLSNGKEVAVDARQVVRAILDECKGTVDLSVEQGHGKHSDGLDAEYESMKKAALEWADQF